MTPWHFEVAPPRSGWALAVDVFGIAVACATLFAVGVFVGMWIAGEPSPQPAADWQPKPAVAWSEESPS